MMTKQIGIIGHTFMHLLEGSHGVLELFTQRK